MTVSLGRVLVVDDEPSVALVLRDALADLGYEVRIAESGREALRAAVDFQPATVLLDLKLPDLPGESVIDALRREAPTVPIVVSGNSDAERARGLLQIGAFDYLAKPFQLSVLERNGTVDLTLWYDAVRVPDALAERLLPRLLQAVASVIGACPIAGHEPRRFLDARDHLFT